MRDGKWERRTRETYYGLFYFVSFEPLDLTVHVIVLPGPWGSRRGRFAPSILEGDPRATKPLGKRPRAYRPSLTSGPHHGCGVITCYNSFITEYKFAKPFYNF